MAPGGGPASLQILLQGPALQVHPPRLTEARPVGLGSLLLAGRRGP